ncbi:MAG: T9SS type A sorting domain-containing protein, partial [Clostridia bacterium]|nr:T9SS type A sorting domain-containing protein [Clostridia bacterium]
SATTSGTLSVTASNSCGTSTARTQAITVNPNLPVSVTIATTSNPTCYGVEAVFTATPTNAGGTPIYQWRLNGSIIGSNSPYYSNTSLVNGDIITCILTSSETCTSGNPATSNTITMSVNSPPVTSLSNGDYVWSGNIDSNWEVAGNWLVYDGSDFATAILIPDNNKNVFLRDYSPCASNPASVTASSNVSCNDVTIETELTLGANAILEVHGDWNNSGTFTAGTGTVLFVGNSQQIITPNGETFNNVVINNTSGNNAAILLNNDLRIGGQLTLTSGIVSFANPVRKLILGNSATTNVGNANSFIDGIVEKTNCNSSFTLPTGNVNTRDIGTGMQTYRIWAPFTANPSSATTVNARYLFSNDGLNQWWYHDWTHEAPLTHTSAREYWLVNSSSDLYATLYWRNNDPCAIHDFCEPGPVFNSEDLTVAYWDNIWKDAGGTASTDYQNGSITSSAQVPFGAKGERQITFGAKDTEMPLPIELTFFKAGCLNNLSAEISWQTASETNNNYFVIEKSNGKEEFYEIARVQGAGNSNQALEYLFIDENLYSGDNYYRLTQVDYDGKHTIFNVITINCDKSEEGEASIYAYPNPFTDELNVVIENLKETEFVLEIYDDLGRLVFTQEFENTGSSFRTKLNLKEYRPAVYNLRSRSEGSVLNTRVVKR